MAVRTLEDARAWRAKLEALTQGSADAAASTLPSAFPLLTQSGALIRAGTRINWLGTLKRAAVDLWDTEENTPDAAPTLWEDIAYRDGIRIIPGVLTAGTAFAKGELGWWGDVLCRSVYDGANVWTPQAHPAAWEKVEAR